MLRTLICVMLLAVSSASWAIDPILLLLLRMARDQILTSSLQAGVDSMREEPLPAAPVFGYALPVQPPEKGAEEQYLKTLIDDSFLHLNSAQRAAVHTSMQNMLRDPQNAAIKSQILAEFALKARSVREGYRQLDNLSYAEKKALAVQAKEEFRRLPPGERRDILAVLQTGMLPVPRDLSEIMAAEFSTLTP